MSTQDQSQNQKCHIDSLPDELLSATFSMGTRSASVYDKFSIPMVVSAVSLHWRQIAINTPSLWTSIFVNFWMRNFCCNVPLFIERSKMQPLSFNIVFNATPFVNRADRELSYAITRNTDRIREIIVWVQSLRVFYHFALPFNALSFPILTRLEIESRDLHCLSDHPRLLTGAKHVQSMVFPGCLACAPLGPDLTHLEIIGLACSIGQLGAVLQASPSLHTLTLDKIGIWGGADSLPIVAPSLHTLCFTVHNEHSPSNPCKCLLSNLVTPNLINLTVKYYRGAFSFPKHFSTSPQIEKLKIDGLTLTTGNASWIQKLSTLTHIELMNTNYTSLWSNSEANNSSDPWQNLTTITIDKASLGDRAQMVIALCRSYTQSPRTITLNIVNWGQGNLEELQSELPNMVFNFVKLELDMYSNRIMGGIGHPLLFIT